MEFIDSLKNKGHLDERQAAYAVEVESRRLFSVHAEVRALLYLGAVFLIAGAGATVKKHFDELGPLAIIGSLSAAVAACFYFCFSRALPYSRERVEHPSVALDYLLYLGCALLGIEFAYLETQFHLLEKLWDFYLLISAGLFFFLAYRFDNRLVLALALLNLWGFWEVRTEALLPGFFAFRPRAILYGLSLLGASMGLENAGIKRHFSDVYLNIGCNAILAALLSGVFGDSMWGYFLVLFAASLCVAAYGLRKKMFKYFLYGVAYAYIGLSRCLLDDLLHGPNIGLYFLVSATGLLIVLFSFRKSLEQAE